MCADVVIVGGGPVGCWTAIQIKKRNPQMQVHIYERHADYQRDHMMSIDKVSLQRYSKRTGDALETEFFRKVAMAHDSSAALDSSAELKSVTHIRTLNFEAILKEHCEKLGIGFTYDLIESPQDIMTRHPECSHFIAADGAHSAMRTALLGQDSVIKKDVLHSVDVRYEAKGQAHYLKAPTYDKIDLVVIETVGREQGGRTSVALRILVDEETYDAIPAATFKKPLNLSDIPKLEAVWSSVAKNKAVCKFSNDVRAFQALREEGTGEKLIPDSEKITKVKLSQYASRKFAVTVDHENRKAGWFLVGDSAMGVPFYRSVNAGLLLGSQLGAILSQPDYSPAFKAGAYNALRPLKLAREFGAVTAKMSGIKIYKDAIRPCLRFAAIAGIGIIASPIIIGVAVYAIFNPRARVM